MGRILSIIVDKITPYLASNGGPIVMLQVENEYTYYPNQEMGKEYVEWAVKTATNLTKNNPVPWIMCEHNPYMNTSTAIQTINGFWDEHQGITHIYNMYIYIYYIIYIIYIVYS